MLSWIYILQMNPLCSLVLILERKVLVVNQDFFTQVRIENYTNLWANIRPSVELKE